MKIKFLKRFSVYFFGIILLGLLSVNTFAQAQKKTDGVYGPMNWGLDREDGFEFEKLRYDHEINRLLREKEAQIIAVSKEMKKCRTSECRAPLHRKIDQIEINNRKDLAAEAELHYKRMELLNKYWDEQDKKPKPRRIYFP